MKARDRDWGSDSIHPAPQNVGHLGRFPDVCADENECSNHTCVVPPLQAQRSKFCATAKSCPTNAHILFRLLFESSNSESPRVGSCSQSRGDGAASESARRSCAHLDGEVVAGEAAVSEALPLLDVARHVLLDLLASVVVRDRVHHLNKQPRT